MHVLIDATNLKVYGAGEWLVEKHGDRGTRTWWKLYLAVDPSSGEIVNSELTSNDEGDTSQVSSPLEQIPGIVASVTADGTYDGETVFRVVAERQSDPTVVMVIPPRSTAMPCPDATTTPYQREQHIRCPKRKGAWAGKVRSVTADDRTRRRRCSAKLWRRRFSARLASRSQRKTSPQHAFTTSAMVNVLTWWRIHDL